MPRQDHDGADSLREEVRGVVSSLGAQQPPVCDAWMRGHDPVFTRVLAERRLIGMTWPEELGGRGCSNVERLIVTEELLRVGAPVAAHWIADRQIGPAILRHGSPALQREVLPRIATGEVTFCLGMSETESGSDLAALRTRAVWDGHRFRITGRKIWTSHAHRSTHAYVLARTGEGEEKHDGLTEFIVDLSSPGVAVRPIFDLAGEHHFNETILDDVVVPAGNVIGDVGAGWRQVTEQLAFERGGMERVLSTYPLLAATIHQATRSPHAERRDADMEAVGVLVARLHTLRAMALDVARAMDAGEAPVHRAAILKHLGTTFEGDVVEAARYVLGTSPDPGGAGVTGMFAGAIFASPGATLRGGATEVLLTIIARQELSGAKRRRTGSDGEFRGLVEDALKDLREGTSALGAGAVWERAVELGWTGIGVAEQAGGSGGDLHDLAVVASELAGRGLSAPVVETALAGGLLADAGRPFDPRTPMTLALEPGVSLTRVENDVLLSGAQARAPWARLAGSALLAVSTDDGDMLVELSLDRPGVSTTQGTNSAGEARDRLELCDVRLPSTAVVGGQAAVDSARMSSAALSSASITGAANAAVRHAREHVSSRIQFGRPLAAFQAVGHTIARMAAETEHAEIALHEALAESESAGQGWRTVAARIVASRAATSVAKNAHQMLGAMGITREHPLHLATLRLWAWRDEHVPERELARRLGKATFEQGEDAIWNWCVRETENLDESGRSAWRTR